jgi:hypothetical protein
MTRIIQLNAVTFRAEILAGPDLFLIEARLFETHDGALAWINRCIASRVCLGFGSLQHDKHVCDFIATQF